MLTPERQWEGGGTILRTTNGGANWTSQSSGTTDELYGISFTDANTGMAVGVGMGDLPCTILRTTNGGTSWTSQKIGTTEYLSGVSFTDANTGTAVGYGGTILRTNTGGIITGAQNREPNIPRQIVLNQNYPNPFNPTTIIEYNLQTSANVYLQVYDLLGRNVATLVEEFQQAGKKSIEFNASRFPSGVYFYRHQAGSFTETKKLVLLR